MKQVPLITAWTTGGELPPKRTPDERKALMKAKDNYMRNMEHIEQLKARILQKAKEREMRNPTPFPEKLHQDATGKLSFAQRRTTSTTTALFSLLPEVRKSGFVIITMDGETIKFFPNEIGQMVDEMERVLKQRLEHLLEEDSARV